MMNPMHYYHTPIKPISTRASCPVCHETVYSRAGIHPQCAVIQSDPPKSRSKKQPGPAPLEEAQQTADQSDADVVIEPPIVEPISAAARLVVPSTADDDHRVVLKPLGAGKGTCVRLIR
jgi:hypothetical protein